MLDNLSLYRKLMLFVFVSLIFPSARTHAAPQDTIGNQFLYGYCIHLGLKNRASYAFPSQIEDKLSELGAVATRDDLSWDIRKAYSLQTIPPEMERIKYSMMNIKARPVLILTGNHDAIPEGQPHTQASRQAFADYARDAAVALKDANPVFEIWNEWNRGHWGKGNKSGDPVEYVELVKTAYPVIKSIMPDGLVLAGATGKKPGTIDMDNEWTIEAVKHGLLDYADGLSVHVYDHRCMKPAGGTGVAVLENIRELHDELQTIYPNRDIPIYVTEMGWPGENWLCGGQADEVAADGVAQVLLTAPTFPWLKGIWFYELVDSGDDPKNTEHHWGMFSYAGNIKPSGCAARDVWPFIKDTQNPVFSNPVDGVSMVTYDMEDGGKRVALWRNAYTDPKSGFHPMVNITDNVKIHPLCGSPAHVENVPIELERTPLLLEIDDEKDYQDLVSKF